MGKATIETWKGLEDRLGLFIDDSQTADKNAPPKYVFLKTVKPGAQVLASTPLISFAGAAKKREYGKSIGTHLSMLIKTDLVKPESTQFYHNIPENCQLEEGELNYFLTEHGENKVALESIMKLLHSEEKKLVEEILHSQKRDYVLIAIDNYKTNPVTTRFAKTSKDDWLFNICAQFRKEKPVISFYDFKKSDAWKTPSNKTIIVPFYEQEAPVINQACRTLDENGTPFVKMYEWRRK